MQSVSLIDQWVDELHRFLEINEDLPVYKTKTGKEKQRKDLIGVLHGSKNTLTGIIDVVSVNSIYDNEGNCRLNHEYGMVIVDECHHGASHVFENVLRQINSKYIYGVSANDKRIDRLEKKVYMQLGPIRHQYTSKERIEKQSIDHHVYPRFTRIMALGDSKNDLNSAYAFISKNENRNNMIISDIKKCIKENRTPIVLTRYKDHAKLLYESLKKNVLDHTYLIYGDHTLKENEEVRKTILALSHDEPYTNNLIDLLYGNGVFVEVYPDLDSYFAVIDQEIVWHGGINLLGKSNIYDSLMRVKSTTIAEELILSPTETKDCDS